MITKIINELEKRLEKSHYQPIIISMKSDNEKITIKPCTQNEYDVEYYIIDCATLNIFTGAQSIEELAQIISNYEKLKEENAADKAGLQKRKEWFIGHTRDELISGNNILISYDYQKFLMNYVRDYAAFHNMPVDKCINAIEVAEQAQAYSDLYKSINGCRPNLEELFS